MRLREEGELLRWRTGFIGYVILSAIGILVPALHHRDLSDARAGVRLVPSRGGFALQAAW